MTGADASQFVTSKNCKAMMNTGAMASLLVGMLLNVRVRSLEFLAAAPAMNGNALFWKQVLFAAMPTDVIIMNFLPKLTMAQIISGTTGLPDDVAEALASLLHGSIQKVIISMAVWLPDPIMSERVNLTYRGRVAL